MKNLHVGILHPGAMGVSLGATIRNTGHTACWASEGRSEQTRERAEAHEFVDLGTVEALCNRCSVIISVCPPHAATRVAEQVLACSFTGLYADVNAISPDRATEFAHRMAAAGITFVDGGIIGGPAWQPGSTWLHLAGVEADRVAACFAAGPLETEVMGDVPGTASALKMCFAANTKGVAALRCAVMAAAHSLGVRAELERQWARYDAEQVQRTQAGVRGVTGKAWRFAGEMEEIAETFAAAGLPAGFHQGAADMYRRLACFKDADALPPLEDVLAALLDDSG